MVRTAGTTRRTDGGPPAPDAGMERFARLAASVMGAPVALVALAGADRLELPGLVGLKEGRDALRRPPLSRSLSGRVVATGEPLIVTDLRDDARFSSRETLAERQWGLVSYAGMPLTAYGQVVGVLCAACPGAREWTGAQLADLSDLASACSAELRSRAAARSALMAQQDAERDHRVAERARAVAEQAGVRAQAGWDAAELLLRASQELAGAATLHDVQHLLRDLVSEPLKPVHTSLSLIQDGRLRPAQDTGPDKGPVPPGAEPAVSCALDADHPLAQAARGRRLVSAGDPGELARAYGEAVAGAFALLDVRALVCVPLTHAGAVHGVLLIGWGEPHDAGPSERAVLTAIAGYVGQAVQRAGVLDERVSVARQLQSAMLTDLPDGQGLGLAALYLAAAADDLVGGDWYDAFPLPGPAASALAVAVGDITGHDMQAATVMGQTRAMLRQAVLDHPGLGPAAAVTALQQACGVLSLPLSGTLLLGHLAAVPRSRNWSFTWTNAGHPPPLLARPGEPVECQEEHGLMLFPGLDPGPRHDHRTHLEPGTVLLLYTDGLVDRPGTTVDEATAGIARVLAACRDLPLPDLLNAVAAEAGPHPDDDIALLAIRVPHGQEGQAVLSQSRVKRAKTMPPVSPIS
ncbi:Stage II sporulation protein E (SpoIIE) [Nonomuraea coxensis DSM 45129]|uniref:Stage II sporulation protein E (SpoIIE) n=1 Tax=Nonomuraea coxensis DSM 45129 TaxID=1122611 RepID=A0ABX8U1F2_9ACTN|nr:SpoIIE family protein phosphatase [Nonomuraea coxensis]QYC41520.1 Stage II sporulation protein E (SpoIIE) [Nonomuraea coxensis DSM 45129]